MRGLSAITEDGFYLKLFSLVYSGNHGCEGGNMYNSFWYIVENEGIATESSYPYKRMVTV